MFVGLFWSPHKLRLRWSIRLPRNEDNLIRCVYNLPFRYSADVVYADLSFPLFEPWKSMLAAFKGTRVKEVNIVIHHVRRDTAELCVLLNSQHTVFKLTLLLIILHLTDSFLIGFFIGLCLAGDHTMNGDVVCCSYSSLQILLPNNFKQKCNVHLLASFYTQLSAWEIILRQPFF